MGEALRLPKITDLRARARYSDFAWNSASQPGMLRPETEMLTTWS